jgi:hypothetical protein
MVVSDAAAQAIYLLDPSNPTSVQTFPTPTVPPYNGITTNACGIAVSNAGIVYYAAFVQGGDGYDQFFQLDTNTGTVTPYSIHGPGTPATDIYLRAELNAANTTVFFNDDGAVASVDTATEKIFYATVDPACCYGNYELALSNDQTQLTATSYLYDAALSAESYYALNDREILNIAYVYGAKLSPDGRLLFQPSTNGVDVLDGNLGNLRNRISLPVALSPNYDALVDDGTDNILIAITGTGNGIAVVDLTSVPEPPPLPYDKVASRTRPRVETENSWHSASNLGRQPKQQKPEMATQHRTVPHVTKRLLPPRRYGVQSDLPTYMNP